MRNPDQAADAFETKLYTEHCLSSKFMCEGITITSVHWLLFVCAITLFEEFRAKRLENIDIKPLWHFLTNNLLTFN